MRFSISNYLLGIDSFLGDLACIHPQVACIFPVSYAFRQYAFLFNPPKSFFFLIHIGGIRISIFLVQQRSFLWLSQNICCLSMKINYHGGDYLTLSDGYCSGMLFEQLVYSSGYVMLLQFTGSEEAPEGFILDMVSNANLHYVYSCTCIMCADALC